MGSLETAPIAHHHKHRHISPWCGLRYYIFATSTSLILSFFLSLWRRRRVVVDQASEESQKVLTTSLVGKIFFYRMSSTHICCCCSLLSIQLLPVIVSLSLSHTHTQSWLQPPWLSSADVLLFSSPRLFFSPLLFSSLTGKHMRTISIDPQRIPSKS